MSTERYPEHAKLGAIENESQVIGQFLDMALPKLGIVLYEARMFDCECRCCERGDPLAGHAHEELAPGLPVQYEHWVPTRRSVKTLLAEHFGIDQNALDREKAEMLDALGAA